MIRYIHNLIAIGIAVVMTTTSAFAVNIDPSGPIDPSIQIPDYSIVVETLTLKTPCFKTDSAEPRIKELGFVPILVSNPGNDADGGSLLVVTYIHPSNQRMMIFVHNQNHKTSCLILDGSDSVLWTVE